MTIEATDTGTVATDAGGTQTTADQTTATVEAKDGIQATDSATDAGTKGTAQKTDEPIKYDFKAPEGMALDVTAVDEFKAIASELKLPTESAQKVVDLYAKLEQKRAEGFAAQVETWGEQVKTDKEIGGDKLTENLAAARKVVDTFGTSEFKSLLDSTGMGNHPEVVRLMSKIGKAISEDGFVRGSAKSTTAQTMYPNSNMN
jgi:hypothetical protein